MNEFSLLRRYNVCRAACLAPHERTDDEFLKLSRPFNNFMILSSENPQIIRKVFIIPAETIETGFYSRFRKMGYFIAGIKNVMSEIFYSKIQN